MKLFIVKFLLRLKRVYVDSTSRVQSRDIGSETRIWAFCNIMERVKIGKNCNICDRCFIEEGVIIGDNVTVKTGVSIWTGVLISDDVFIGPGVQFCNDRYPRSKNYVKPMNTYVHQGASIGAGATILPGLVIGKGAMVGAGSVVTKNVAEYSTVAGNPAREMNQN